MHPSAPRPIGPRRVCFDWQQTPTSWIPGEPTAAHVTNALHLLLPSGERWFIDVFREALPLVRDEGLRTRMKGFMGQEATHSVQHAGVVDHLARAGLDARPFAERLDRVFAGRLGRRSPAAVPRSEWLRTRLAVIAAIEHYTAVLGDWILRADTFEHAGADPTMLELLRWHGAEEVEHRAVAYDVFAYLGGRGPVRYARRLAGFAVATALLLWFWFWGAAYLMATDPQRPGGKYKLSEHNRAIRNGLLPSWRLIGTAIGHYLRPGFHPDQESSAEPAHAYLSGRWQ
ncbi:metal-dependent hydrolase [Nocardia sp. alder85J]|uniref:metal-dependent hydrolase n=1 Tax=Nocardia sp. alder85J TaxID=2862949 RepID=UPI001CD7ECA2|nr:metal-dependent hydrolase [Nocardia sp. alder85J]MCX4098381.1 metal-dependent hydrolase [Nocardia sp. alder85J]